MRRWLPIFVAIGSGGLTLLAYFLPIDQWLDFHLRQRLVDWVSTLAAVALLVGILNLAAVHVRKVSDYKPGWPYSTVLLLSLTTVFLMWLLSLAQTPTGRLEKLGRDAVRYSFEYLQTPVEASLAAVSVVVMVLAGVRLIRTRRSWSAVAFVLISMFLILGVAPLNGLAFLQEWRDWIVFVPVAGGARGILLGIALGTITTGLRVIVGADRPYGE